MLPFILHISLKNDTFTEVEKLLPWTLRTEENLAVFKCLSAIFLFSDLLRYNLHVVEIHFFVS